MGANRQAYASPGIREVPVFLIRTVLTLVMTFSMPNELFAVSTAAKTGKMDAVPSDDKNCRRFIV